MLWSVGLCRGGQDRLHNLQDPGQKNGSSVFNNGEEFQAGDEQSFELTWAFLIQERAGAVQLCGLLSVDLALPASVLAGVAATSVQVVLVCVNFFSSQVR